MKRKTVELQMKNRKKKSIKRKKSKMHKEIISCTIENKKCGKLFTFEV